MHLSWRFWKLFGHWEQSYSIVSFHYYIKLFSVLNTIYLYVHKLAHTDNPILINTQINFFMLRHTAEIVFVLNKGRNWKIIYRSPLTFQNYNTTDIELFINHEAFNDITKVYAEKYILLLYSQIFVWLKCHWVVSQILIYFITTN